MIYHFLDYQLDDGLYQLRRAGEVVKVTPKVFDVLAYLLQNRDRVVTKEELKEKLWPNQVIGEDAVIYCIVAARKAVGDDGSKQQIIKTQQGRGYRFVAPITTTQPVTSSQLSVVRREATDSDGPETVVSVQNLHPPTPNTQHPAPLSLPNKPSIAVLPFTNMSTDPTQDYFSDGLTEDLITDLAKLSGLFVIARHSVFTYKGKAVRVEQVGQELGVRYVLDGSVRRTDEQVRVTAQLIDALTGHHLWAERYDRPLKDIFALQDEIRQQIVTGTRVNIQEAERQRVRHIPTESLTSYDSLVRGMECFWQYTPVTNSHARRLFERALTLDPTYAEAYAWLGRTYFIEWALQWSDDRQTVEKTYDLEQRALAFDNSLAFAHATLSWVYLWGKKQHDHAIAEAKHAVILSPSETDGHIFLGESLIFAGQPEEAIATVAKAIRLDPLSPNPRDLLTLGRAYLVTRQYEAAITALRSVVVRAPNNLGARVNLASLYGEVGRTAEAHVEAAEVLRISPTFSVERMGQRIPFKDPTERERYVASLRKAGLK